MTFDNKFFKIISSIIESFLFKAIFFEYPIIRTLYHQNRMSTSNRRVPNYYQMFRTFCSDNIIFRY